MDIVIIGTGNAATILGRKFKGAGHRIVQVFGRNASAASQLAYMLGTESTNYWSMISKNADIYLIAVSDYSIKEIAEHLQLPGKLVVHTAAAIPKEVLKKITKHYGVFYPMQSLRKEMKELPEIPIHIDASDENTLRVLERLAGSISEKVTYANDEERLKMHVAAVICNNFTNYLYAMAEDYCKKENLDFKLLLPLIRETAEKVQHISPSLSQTGPAERNDETTIKKHLTILKPHPELQKLYEFMTESILKSNL